MSKIIAVRLIAWWVVGAVALYCIIAESLVFLMSIIAPVVSYFAIARGLPLDVIRFCVGALVAVAAYPWLKAAFGWWWSKVPSTY